MLPVSLDSSFLTALSFVTPGLLVGFVLLLFSVFCVGLEFLFVCFLSSFCVLCPIVLVSLDCPFLTALSFITPGFLVGFVLLLCLVFGVGLEFFVFFFLSSFCVLCPIVPVSSDCPFLIAPSVFSNVN